MPTSYMGSVFFLDHITNSISQSRWLNFLYWKSWRLLKEITTSTFASIEIAPFDIDGMKQTIDLIFFQYQFRWLLWHSPILWNMRMNMRMSWQYNQVELIFHVVCFYFLFFMVTLYLVNSYFSTNVFTLKRGSFFFFF